MGILTGFRGLGVLVMAKSDSKKEPELHPDAWARFERAIDVVAKSPPQHRTKIAKPKKASPKRPRTRA
jgi:hypothetical protein